MVLEAISRVLRASAVLFVLTGQPVGAQQTASAPPAAQCALWLQAVDRSWRGACGPIFGNKEATTLTARRVEKLPGGAGRGDAIATRLLVGELAAAPPGAASVEFEFFGENGVIRTQMGWRPVIVIKESPTTLSFRVAEDSNVEPSDLDRRIVERAAAILSTEAAWDRNDDRQCATEDKTWSIYCAFQRASLEVTGGFHHRRPSLEIMRAILYERVDEQRKKGRKYPHILMDYNNDPTTQLADLQSLFTEIAARIKR